MGCGDEHDRIVRSARQRRGRIENGAVGIADQKQPGRSEVGCGLVGDAVDAQRSVDRAGGEQPLVAVGIRGSPVALPSMATVPDGRIRTQSESFSNPPG